jgi:hypothetical protein
MSNSVQGGDVLFTNTGVPILYDFGLSGERLLFLLGFVAISENGLLENGARYNNITACY